MVDSLPLEIKGVRKAFGSLPILEGVDLTLHAGETISIVGPSGSGKSTLLHVAGLMEHPTAGEVWIQGQPTASLSSAERARWRLDTIGFMFQFHYLLPDFNVLENTLIPCRLAGENLIAAEKEARDLLDQLGLSERITHRPDQLSGGEQQRAALARAMIRKPALLLCDEPTGNLDPHTAEKIGEMIQREAQKRHAAVVFVTHNDALANRADTVYHLIDGKLNKRI